VIYSDLRRGGRGKEEENEIVFVMVYEIITR